jgi:hypothetical protein
MINPIMKLKGSSSIREEYKKTLKLTKGQKNILIGTLLGDGCLTTRSKKGKYPTFNYQFKQKESKKDYVYHIFEKFQNLCGSYPVRVKQGQSLVNDEILYAWSFKTGTIPALKFYADQFYSLDNNSGKSIKVVPKLIHRWLTPEALAYWFMDDGSKDSSGYRLHTQCFSIKEVERLADALGKNFKFEVNIHKAKNKKTGKTYHLLYITSKSREAFTKIVLPYILPCCKYKLFI